MEPDKKCLKLKSVHVQANIKAGRIQGKQQ